jgi:AraC-like DNA-binding protein
VLVGIVERLWYVEDHRIRGQEVKLPTTGAQIIINLDADRLTTRPAVPERATVTAGSVAVSPIAPTAVILDRREQRRTAGVVLRPEALGAVAGVTAESLDVLVDASQLWGPAAERLTEVGMAARTGPEALNRIEAALAVMLHERAEPDSGCRAAIDQLSRGAPVAETARRVGLSQSTLVRRFRAEVGMTPKRYQRLLRLERVIASSGHEIAPDWARLSTDCGYADQSHLTHEFTALTTFSPAEWRSAMTADPFHIAVDDFLQDAEGGIGSD